MNSHERPKDDLLNRLKRIEGQIKGIMNMIEEDKYCTDIIVQISAAKGGLNKVSGMILEGHIKGCVRESLINGDDKVIDNLVETLVKYTK